MADGLLYPARLRGVASLRPPAACSSAGPRTQRCSPHLLSVGHTRNWNGAPTWAATLGNAAIERTQSSPNSLCNPSTSRQQLAGCRPGDRSSGNSRRAACRALGVEGESNQTQSGGGKSGAAPSSLQIGNPIVIVEAPPFVKSAEPMPMLRENKGQIKEGDVGR